MRDLRPHQQKAIDLVKASFLAGHRRIMLQLPTAAGKTRLAAEIIEGALRKGRKVAFTVPRIDLIDQTVESLWLDGIREIGVIQADHPMTDPSKPVQVCSVQSLAARTVPEADLVLVDEAHEHHKVMIKWMSEAKKTLFVGLSATPWSKGLGKHYTDLLIAATTQELIEAGYLAPFKVFAPSAPDLSGVKVRAGDYDESQLSEAMSEGKLVADIVSTWCEKAQGLPTIAFCVDRAHASRVQAEFLSVGIPWGYVDFRSSRLEVKRIGDQLRSGALMGVSNVDKLTTGIDWDVRCIINARPTKSEMRYVQGVGRGLRLAPGKQYLTLLDHSNTTETLGFVTDIHHDKLSMGKRKESSATEREKPLPKTCKACSHVYSSGPACPSCGHSSAMRCGVDVVDGELVEFTSAKKRGSKKEATMSDKAWFFGELKAYAKERGYAPGWAARKYKDRYSVWPNHPQIKDAPERALSAGTHSWIRSRNIAWAKSQEKSA